MADATANSGRVTTEAAAKACRVRSPRAVRRYVERGSRRLNRRVRA
ncbi:MAG: hypothetical protein M3Q49_15265 [Actinomycetota bacterium]|nr:hypothetical protein [Actinomycetota bacterium]